MAAPLSSAFALSFKPCSHHKGRNFMTSVSLNDFVIDVFHKFHEGGKAANALIKCSREIGATPGSIFEVEGGMTIGTLVHQFGIKFIEFTCVETPADSSSSGTLFTECAKEATVKAVDAFQLLMAGGRRFTTKKTTSQGLKTGLSRKDELYNNLVDDFKSKGLDFPRGTETDEGTYIVQVLCNALWYCTNHHTTINDAAARYKDVLPIPPAFENYDGYNDVKRKKVKMTQMNSRELESHSQALYSLLMKPVVCSTAKWTEGMKEIEQLAECLGAYKRYLDQKTTDSKTTQNKTEPARTIDKHATLETRMGSPFGMKDKYRLLNKAVVSEGVKSYVVFDELVHLERPFKSPDEKYKYFKKMQLAVPVDMIKFSPGGSLEATVVVRQVMPNRSEPQILTEGARFLQNVRPQLGEIHTRLQRKTFRSKVANIAKVSPAISDYIYTHLTLDKSAAENPVTQERLRLIFSGHTGLVKDLRELNPGRPNNKFDTFFDVLSGILEEVTSADDRRHGEAHMSQFISLDEMVQQAKSKCPEGTSVPSKSLVRLQFAPKNPFTKVATTFTSKLNIQYKVQRRQLRVAHPDEHYCNAQFRYMKECAIEHKEQAKLLFCDDKAKVPFGNPGALLSTGVRGKQSIVPTTSTLSALDHDMQSSGSLTPSVYLDCKIPDSPTSSFVRGQVTVIVNDSVFKTSSPMRHASALVKILTVEEQVPPLLFKFTDGGCDQRNTLESVKCASICIFKELNLDMLVLGRCAPNHSYMNPAERVMSVLNLGLQNVALERKPCDQAVEKILGQCSSMADIREKSVKHPNLKQSWEESVEELTTKLGCRFARLKLKDKPFNVLNPVLDEDIDILQRHLRELFPDLNLSKLTKATTSKCETYKTWMSRHARSRNYTFQLRKCSDSSCCLPSTISTDDLVWLPDPVLDEEGYHYKPYSDVKGTETNDDNRPSLVAKQQKQQPKPSTQQPVQHDGIPELEERDPEMPTNEPSLCTVQNARAVVNCTECCKPRVIYSKHKLSERQKLSLVLSISEYIYSCGAPILPPSCSIFKTCMCRNNLSCETPIETPYYGSELGRKDLCSFCGIEECLVDQELKKQYKTVLPCCEECRSHGKTPVVMRPFGKAK